MDDLGVGQKELERQCSRVTYRGQPRRGLQPLSRADQTLFAAVLRGEFAVRGFRNRELATHLFASPPGDAAERRRRCGQVCRQISLLRAHGLLAKVPRSRRYRVTTLGHRFMSTALHLRSKLFPTQLSHAL